MLSIEAINSHQQIIKYSFALILFLENIREWKNLVISNLRKNVSFLWFLSEQNFNSFIIRNYLRLIVT